jgi:hypothetical protein
MFESLERTSSLILWPKVMQMAVGYEQQRLLPRPTRQMQLQRILRTK